MEHKFVIKTGIGSVKTKLPHDVPKNGAPVPQKIEPLSGSSPGLCWFDEMLGKSKDETGAGLVIPENNGHSDGRPFLMIVSGPPGSAKSTFTLQLCYNFVRFRGNPQGSDARPAALYVTTETSGQHITDKVDSFGWQKHVFEVLDSCLDQSNLRVPNFTGKPADKCYIYALPSPLNVTEPVPRTPGEAQPIPLLRALQLQSDSPRPDIVVIDSFNTVPGFKSQDPDHPIRQLMEYCCNPKAMRPRLLIVVLDFDGEKQSETQGFDYFADATIRFNMTLDDKGLLHRTVEITKIKTQKHAEGEHVIEIFEKPPEAKFCHRSPFLDEGGLFVYPRIQWYLSYLRANPASAPLEDSPAVYQVLPAEVGEIIAPRDSKSAGFQAGHIVSLVGKQNILKTRFAYACLLKNVLAGGEIGLIVSLDANEDVVCNILAGLIESEFEEELQQFEKTLQRDNPVLYQQLEPTKAGFESRLALKRVQYLFYDDKLSFIHYEPAYISPGEFFHRVYVALKRPRQGFQDTARREERAGFVIVDGLDQIESKFPLCAKEPLFVSSLVSLFKTDKHACAVFISSQDPEDSLQPSASALLPLSDLLLKFIEPTTDDEVERARNLIEGVRKADRHHESARNCVYVHAIRVPFGLDSEVKGILWTSPAAKADLRFNVPFPLSRGFEEGD